MTSERIDLAHEADFTIGPLTVHPSTREVARGEDRQIVEPRVMQVFVALYRAGGAVVSKDDLARSCWEGRIVGEDAINRVLSRLRKLTEGIAQGIFRIETVTRVGYRLIVESGDLARVSTAGPTFRKIDRRTALIGGGASAALIGAGAWYATRPPSLPDELADLMDRAETALRYGTPEQTANGIALLQEATQRFPDRTEPWGKLGLAYMQQGRQSPSAEAARLFARGRSAATRALHLDPENIDANVMRIMQGPPDFRNWPKLAARCRAARSRYADHYVTRNFCAAFFFNTGQVRESLAQTAPLVAADDSQPQLTGMHAMKLWAVGRDDEADAMLERAANRWPRHYAVWFSRFKMLAYSGRAGAALAMLDDIGRRPVGIPDSNFALSEAEAKALRTGATADIDAALALYLPAARSGAGFAGNAILFTSAVGQLDLAFELTEQLYFGPPPPEVMFTREQGLFSPGQNATYLLFQPPTAALRADPRFLNVTRRLGLEGYWRSAGVRPDYRRFA